MIKIKIFKKLFFFHTNSKYNLKLSSFLSIFLIFLLLLFFFDFSDNFFSLSLSFFLGLILSSHDFFSVESSDGFDQFFGFFSSSSLSLIVFDLFIDSSPYFSPSDNLPFGFSLIKGSWLFISQNGDLAISGDNSDSLSWVNLSFRKIAYLCLDYHPDILYKIFI